MKKQITAFALGLLMATNLMPQMTASAASVPTSKTITLPSESIWSTVGDVKVEVTYTGFIGELDAAANGLSDNDGTINGKIPVLKEGSEIKFKIIADDPAAYYNFCYEKTRYDDSVTNGEYGWDDAGGGRFYYDAQNSYFDVQVYGQADGTSKFAAGPLFQDNLKAFGRKISTNEYSYQAVNGLMNYQFTAKDKPVDNVYIPQGGVAGYTLGTALTINDEQIKEFEQTGTMTFLKGVKVIGENSVEYQHVYKGLAELLRSNVEKKPLTFIVEKDDSGVASGDEHNYDNGVAYKATVTNNTNESANNYYALISYIPNAVNGYEFSGQSHYFDIKLNALESKEYKFNSFFPALASGSFKFVWVKFDSLSDKEQFDKGVPYATDINLENRLLSATKSIDWMKENFGIEIK